MYKLDLRMKRSFIRYSSNKHWRSNVKGARPFGLWLLLVLIVIQVKGQNLVPNGDFESYNVCPDRVNVFNGYVSNWVQHMSFAGEFYHKCDYWSQGNFPPRNNSLGNCSVTTYRKNSNALPRTYLSNRLIRPLEPNEIIYISYWVRNWSPRSYYVEDYQVYFSDTAVTQQPEANEWWIELPAQVSWTGGIVRDSGYYVPITGCYVAEGGEEYICMGNFIPPDQMRVDSMHPFPQGNFFALDDVKMISAGTVEFRDSTICPGTVYRFDDPYDMGFEARQIGNVQVLDSLIMPNELVELEIFLPECGVVDTIQLFPEACESCFEIPDTLQLCLLDSIVMEDLLVAQTSLLLGGQEYTVEDIFYPSKDTTYRALFRSEYCDTIGFVFIEIGSCNSCGPELEDFILCPGDTFRIGIFSDYQVFVDGNLLNEDIILQVSGTYALHLASELCDTIAQATIFVEACQNCIADLGLDEIAIECYADSSVIKDLLMADMYIENIEDIACQGEKTIYIRHFECDAWLDSIVLTVTITEACYDFVIRDSICQGEILIIEADDHLTLERGSPISIPSGIIQPIILGDVRCPEVIFEREALLFDCVDCHYAIPNVFSPNGDGINDVFNVNSNCSVLRFEAEIYDRWGNYLHYSNNPEQIWNGGSAQNGAYVYRIEMELFNGQNTETIQEHGTITLVR